MPDGGAALVHPPAVVAQALMRLLPTGRAWPREQGAVMPQVVAALAPMFTRLEQRAADLLVDAFPTTAVFLLPEWESTLGLPDPCAGTQSTIALRQRSVQAAIQAQGGQSIAYYTRVAASLGYTITIAEYAPAMYGRAHYGDRLYGAPWAHAWTVTVSAGSIVSASYGSARQGDPYRSWGSAVLECTLGRIKPAHTILRFAYTDPGARTSAPLGTFVLGRNVAP